MVEKALVDPLIPFYEAVSSFLGRIVSVTGPLYFALVNQFEGQPASQWTLLLGSIRLAVDPYDGIAGVAGQMKRLLPARYRRDIAKVGVVGPDDPFYRAISSAFHIPPPPSAKAIFNGSVINGILLQRACLFVSTPPEVASIGIEKPTRNRSRRAR